MVRAITSVAFASGQMTVVYAATASTPSTTDVFALNLIEGPIGFLDVENMGNVTITPAVPPDGGVPPITTPSTYPLPQRDGMHIATVRFADGQIFSADIRDIASPTYASAAAFAAAIAVEQALAIN